VSGKAAGFEIVEFGWDAVSVDPSRSFPRPKGTDSVVPVVTLPEKVLVDLWAPNHVQPSRVTRITPGTTQVSGKPPDIEIREFGWDRTVSPDPGRPIIRARGTDEVAPVSTSPETITPDKWQPTTVQPKRPDRSAATQFATSYRFLATTYPDSWAPIFVQPGRPVVRAAGDRLVNPPQGSDVLFLQPQPVIVQPGRPALRAKGTDLATAVWRFPETVLPDKWYPVMVQPGRSILRQMGTVTVHPPATFYQPVAPDPFRGTSILVGPDPREGITDPAGPDPRRGTTIKDY